MNVVGTDAAGGATRKNGGLAALIDDLPEAEVEVINDTSGYDDSGWFYQEPSSGSNSYDESDWFYQDSGSSNKNTGTGETAYNEIYYAPPETNEYDNAPYSSGSTTQKTEQPVLQNVVEQQTTQPEMTTTAEQEAAAYINAVLGQQASTRPGPVANQGNNSLVSPVLDEDAIRRSIQQSIAQANAKAEASTQRSSAQNAHGMQNILDWDWRNDSSAQAQAKGGNLTLPPNYRPTDSNSGTSMQQVFTPTQQQQSPSLLERVLNIGVTPAYAESDIPVDYGGAASVSPSQATIAPQQMAQLLNDPTARQFFSAAKADGETDTNAAIFALNQMNALNARNARWAAENNMSSHERYQQVQEQTAGQNSLYGNRLNRPESSIERFIDNGGLDKSAQIASDYKNMRVQAENQRRITDTAKQLAKADGLDYNKLSYDQQAVYEDRAAGQTKLVNETTPEYQRQLIQNTIDTNNARAEQTQRDLNNLIGYSDNETGAQDLGNRNYEPIVNQTNVETNAQKQANAISELTLHLANLGYAPDTASYVARYSVENNVDPETVVKFLTAQQYGLENVIEQNPVNIYAEGTGGGKRQADLTEQDFQNMSDISKQLQEKGYNQLDANNIADYAVRYGTTADEAANMFKQGRLEGMVYEAPGFDANGNPNATMQAILNGEFSIDLEAEGLERGTDYYEVARQGNAERILHLFDSADGFTGLVIPKGYEKFFASDSNSAIGAGKVAVWGENGIQITGNPNNVELVKASGEELVKAVDAFIQANPQLQVMIQNGLLTRDDIMNHFFKGITETKEDDSNSKKSYGGGGGGSKKSSSSGSRYRSGGGYGGGGGNYAYAPNDKEQRQARVNNIMKNWTF